MDLVGHKGPKTRARALLTIQNTSESTTSEAPDRYLRCFSHTQSPLARYLPHFRWVVWFLVRYLSHLRRFVGQECPQNSSESGGVGPKHEREYTFRAPRSLFAVFLAHPIPTRTLFTALPMGRVAFSSLFLVIPIALGVI